MSSNKSFVTKNQEIDGGFVAFGGSPKGGKITGKGVTTRTPQQNGVVKRKNRTLIEVARTMLSDSLLPTTFWAEAVNTACYVQNRVLVTKPHNKTPYELLISRSPDLEFMRPFGCPVTILNTLDHLGKINDNADKGFLVGYSINIFVGNQSNGDVGIQTEIHAGQASQEKAAVHEYILLPFIPSNPPLSSSIQSSDVNAGAKPRDVNVGDKLRDVNPSDIQGDVDEISRNDDVCQGNEIRINSSTHAVNAASLSINIANNIIDAGSLNINTSNSNHTNMPTWEVTDIFDGAFNDRDLGAEADTNNLDSSTVSVLFPQLECTKTIQRNRSLK
nr:retrovirus-related Pol polyprotein from transposon TNT 1-94 [Tanacetum cinerariifolium]